MLRKKSNTFKETIKYIISFLLFFERNISINFIVSQKENLKICKKAYYLLVLDDSLYTIFIFILFCFIL